MKHFILFISFLCVVQVSAQRKPKIKGNKQVVDYQEDLPPYSAIELKDDLEIHLERAASEGYAITADDNLIDVLKFKVEDSTLVISSFYNITGKKKLDITVYYNELNAITLLDGKLIADGPISTRELYINTYNSSKLELSTDADLTNVKMEGNSFGDFNVNGGEISLILKDRVDAKVYTMTQLNNVKMYKNASIKLEGTTDQLFADLMESASLKAERLEATKVFLTIQHSANADVNASEDLELTANGSSRTHLYGSPQVTLLEFNDTAELHKEK